MNVVENKVKEILKNSKNIFVYCGTTVHKLAGLNGVLAEHIAYEIEDYYGYSSEEIVTDNFLTRRVKFFFDYYQNIILGKTDPGVLPIAEEIRDLQKYINIETVATDTIYSLYERAGVDNVISINGTVENNYCPNCGKQYDANYVRAHRIIPHCEKCQVPLRPGFTLVGETIDNGLISKAINEAEKCDTFLVIGSTLRDKVFKNLIKYYKGENLILINDKEMFGDDIANYRMYGDIEAILKKFLDEISSELPMREKPVKKEKTDTVETAETTDAAETAETADTADTADK